MIKGLVLDQQQRDNTSSRDGDHISDYTELKVDSGDRCSENRANHMRLAEIIMMLMAPLLYITYII
jgi:hypothetical protein